MVFHFDQQPLRFQIGHDALARFEAIEPRVRRPPLALIFPSSVITSICGSLCRWPISKSFGSCAGVTFTAPVPNSRSTAASAMIGISRFISGSRTFLPTRCR